MIIITSFSMQKPSESDIELELDRINTEINPGNRNMISGNTLKDLITCLEYHNNNDHLDESNPGSCKAHKILYQSTQIDCLVNVELFKTSSFKFIHQNIINYQKLITEFYKKNQTNGNALKIKQECIEIMKQYILFIMPLLRGKREEFIKKFIFDKEFIEMKLQNLEYKYMYNSTSLPEDNNQILKYKNYFLATLVIGISCVMLSFIYIYKINKTYKSKIESFNEKLQEITKN